MSYKLSAVLSVIHIIASRHRPRACWETAPHVPARLHLHVAWKEAQERKHKLPSANRRHPSRHEPDTNRQEETGVA